MYNSFYMRNLKVARQSLSQGSGLARIWRVVGPTRGWVRDFPLPREVRKLLDYWHFILHRKPVGVASRLATAIYLAMVIPIYMTILLV